MNGSDKCKYKEFGDWLKKQRGSHSLKWLADQLGVSVQFIHDVEKGEKRPKASNVGKIAVILGGDPDKLAKMTGWEVTDVFKAYKVALGILPNVDEIISQGKVETFSAACMRNTGFPKQAIEQFSFWIKVFEDRIEAELDSTKDIQDMKRELIRSLAGRMACNTKILKRDQMINQMLKDHAKGISLAISLNDNKGMGMMHSRLAAAYYLAREWKKAIENDYKALPFTENNPALMAEVYRGLMLEYAHLHKPNDFLRIERMALEYINQDILIAPMDKAAIYDGRGRGRAILEKPHVESSLDAAEQEIKKFSEQMEIKPQRSVQNFCSRLINLTIQKAQGFSIDLKHAAEIAYRGRCLAISLGYDRYVRDIERMARYLNIPPFNNPNNEFQLAFDFSN